MNEEIKKNITSSKHWLRFLYMALFVFILYFASIVMLAVVIVQAIFTLLSGDDSLRIKRLGDSLSQYIFSALQYLIYNSDEKPFPFADWPESDAQESTHEEEPTEEPSEELSEEFSEELSNASEVKEDAAQASKTHVTEKNNVQDTDVDDIPTIESSAEKQL